MGSFFIDPSEYVSELIPEDVVAARKFIADRIDDLGEEWEVLVVLGLDQ
jgi:hypothetical protein